MGRKLSSLVVLAALASLALTPNALGVGLGQGQAVAQAARGAQAADTPIAPAAVCPGQTDLTAPADTQEEAMRCMTEYARAHFGLPPLSEAEQLSASAASKSGDVLECDDFSHFACGREFTYWMEVSGYLSVECWRAGENLAWGAGEEGTVRSIFRAWLRSPTHRRNVLGDYDQIGIALRVGELEGLAATRVWTQHFGSQCELS